VEEEEELYPGKGPGLWHNCAHNCLSKLTADLTLRCTSIYIYEYMDMCNSIHVNKATTTDSVGYIDAPLCDL